MDPGETKSQLTTELLTENDALKYCKAATYTSDRTYDIAIIDRLHLRIIIIGKEEKENKQDSALEF